MAGLSRGALQPRGRAAGSGAACTRPSSRSAGRSSFGPISPWPTTTWASVLRDLDEAGEAIEHFRRAAELEPAFAAPRTNLGQMLLNRGQAEEALAHCKQAVRTGAEHGRAARQPGQCLPGAGPARRGLGRVRRSRSLESRAAAGQCPHRSGPPEARSPRRRRAVADDGRRARAGQCVFWEWLAELFGELDEPAAAIPCWEQVRAPWTRSGRPRASPLGRALAGGGATGRSGDPLPQGRRAATPLEPAASKPGLAARAQGRDGSRPRRPFAAPSSGSRSCPRPHARLASLLRGKLPDADLAALEDTTGRPRDRRRPRSHLLFRPGPRSGRPRRLRPRRRLPGTSQRPGPRGSRTSTTSTCRRITNAMSMA